jgi:hypothetical protein
MGLGSDNTVCKKELVDAMRPVAGDNVDRVDVQANRGALGQAVFRIVAERAETSSNASLDAAFWAWIGYVDTVLATWRQAFTNWTPTQPAEQALKASLLPATLPARPPRPTALKGDVL